MTSPQRSNRGGPLRPNQISGRPRGISESAWLKSGDAIPSCPSCGTPFKKASEYAKIACYQANCLERHDPDRVVYSPLVTALSFGDEMRDRGIRRPRHP